MLGGGDEGLNEDDKFGDRVYRRRSFKGLENSNSGNNLLRGEMQKLNSVRRLHNSGLDVGSENFQGLGRDGLAGKGGLLTQDSKIRISLSMKSKHEALELRRKLESEREMVRSLMRKIEANEREKNARFRGSDGRDDSKETAEVGNPRFDGTHGNEVGARGQPHMSRPLNQLNQLSIDENIKAGIDNLEKEKRTPKANKLYRSSEFHLAKDGVPSAETNKKLKSNGKNGGGIGKGIQKFQNRVYKSCAVLLEKLMKHKHGWVFNKPVNPADLGLHDYFEIIKKPMDLGTVKDRLAQNWYKSPLEFAEDVRLTFQNAMTYNPKGQDVYLMADQLSKIFEDKWPRIEADFKHKSAEEFDIGLLKPTSTKAPTLSQVRPDTQVAVDTSHVISKPVDPKRKVLKAAPIPKKPKAKDPDKRGMTYDEKQKLSINLQSLPTEKLESVVKIIRKKNPSVSQQDDEIELDIDAVDTETLWELDRFITNYKKNLSKMKRKAEIVGPVIVGAEQSTDEKITTTDAPEIQMGSITGEEKVSSPLVEVEEPGVINTNKEASPNNSSSDSGSSSSDSGGGSSSGDESDDRHSSKD